MSECESMGLGNVPESVTPRRERVVINIEVCILMV